MLQSTALLTSQTAFRGYGNQHAQEGIYDDKISIDDLQFLLEYSGTDQHSKRIHISGRLAT
jgi:hypothetical protein